ncbi:hypothetical protein HOK51_04555 [Candidatus Woesearchaeota archaeon]|jgi:hypothetical protein|nr:hypothetical protein [Candidatus Woesearchaeota archaeon]MBT6519095.1 hypothetical protein [Candidatus Woesearchaeota archaeon]MBT7367038.1 hypothetical protein [Candidatus Woesearchaeota archaeon]
MKTAIILTTLAAFLATAGCAAPKDGTDLETEEFVQESGNLDNYICYSSSPLDSERVLCKVTFTGSDGTQKILAYAPSRFSTRDSLNELETISKYEGREVISFNRLKESGDVSACSFPNLRETNICTGDEKVIENVAGVMLAIGADYNL